MPQQEPTESPWVQGMRVMGFGLTWALSTLLFLLLGLLVDGWLGTKPVFSLIGAFIGAAAGFWYMYRQLVVEPKHRADGGGRGR